MPSDKCPNSTTGGQGFRDTLDAAIRPQPQPSVLDEASVQEAVVDGRPMMGPAYVAGLQARVTELESDLTHARQYGELAGQSVNRLRNSRDEWRKIAMALFAIAVHHSTEKD